MDHRVNNRARGHALGNVAVRKVERRPERRRPATDQMASLRHRPDLDREVPVPVDRDIDPEGLATLWDGVSPVWGEPELASSRAKPGAYQMMFAGGIVAALMVAHAWFA